MNGWSSALGWLRRIPAGPPERSPHDSRATGILRPVVFGGNDGLVSNLALIMGVAGAEAAPGVIVLAGIAGLLAGAFSMAVGEYISVQSQRELLEFQIVFQRRQLVETPEQERAILARLYTEKGFEPHEAEQIASRLFAEDERALQAMVREEIGLDPRAIGSPMGAAIGSFLAFTLGAVVPLVPYLIASGAGAFTTSLVVSLAALFVLGLGISQLTHRNALYCGLRQLALGGVAAAVTYGVGALVGVRAG